MVVGPDERGGGNDKLTCCDARADRRIRWFLWTNVSGKCLWRCRQTDAPSKLRRRLFLWAGCPHPASLQTRMAIRGVRHRAYIKLPVPRLPAQNENEFVSVHFCGSRMVQFTTVPSGQT